MWLQFLHPLNLLTHTPFRRSAAAGWELFERATRRSNIRTVGSALSSPLIELQGHLTPWLPVATDYAQFNVAIEREDATSMLTLYRQLIELRRASPALTGSYRAATCCDDVLSFERLESGQQLLVALNFDSEPKELRLPPCSGNRVLLSTSGQPKSICAHFVLDPDEGVIVGVAAGTGRTA